MFDRMFDRVFDRTIPATSITTMGSGAPFAIGKSTTATALVSSDRTVDRRRPHLK